MSSGKIPYSVHSFMLPFRWDYLPPDYSLEAGKEQISFEVRTSLNSFLKCVLQQGSFWKRKFFAIGGKAENYNEYHYFHAYAAKTLFDLQQKDEKETGSINANKVMLYFEIETDVTNDTYTIKTVNDGTYLLKLSGISLHVYNTGVAILTINVENDKYPEKEKILIINEFGRRIYPQFLNNEHPHTQQVKKAFLADSIEISIGGKGNFSDDFSEYESIAEREVHHYEGNDFKHSWVVKAPTYIRHLFGDKFSFTLGDEKPDSIRFNILTDDRMFFQSWYGNNDLATALKEKTQDITSENAFTANYSFGSIEKEVKGKYTATRTETEYPYLNNNDWHAYMFGDKGGPCIENKKMQKSLTEAHTYDRWAGYGTLFGLTRDSFVCITGSGDFSELIITQMKTMYYQMAVLCLAQRASVLRFSSEVSNLSDLARSNENKKLIANIKILYKNYIEFINKIYYREITPYIQGMEMYTQFQKIMDLKDNVKDLDEELNELFNYVKLEEDERQGNEAHSLSLIATWFLPASFIASLFGIGFIREYTTLTGKIDWELWKVWLIICGAGALVSWFFIRKAKRKK